MEETSWKVLQHIFVIAKREKYYELHNLWAGHNIEKKKKNEAQCNDGTKAKFMGAKLHC